MGRASAFGRTLRPNGPFQAGPADTIKTTSRLLMAPVELLVNGVRNPLAIDNGEVRLTWMIPLKGRRQIQTAHQLLVSPSPELLAKGHGNLWDSYKVASSQSSSVVYQGLPLSTGLCYWWKVCVCNERGRRSDYSQPATFDIGLPLGQWKASFVWDGHPHWKSFHLLEESSEYRPSP